MRPDGTSEQFGDAEVGATLRRFMDPYPLDEEEVEPEKDRINYRLTKEALKELEQIADYWNELDRTLKVSRKREWSVQTVLDRFRTVGVTLFWNQAGGRPETEEARKEFIARAIDHMKKKQHEKKKQQQK